MLDLINVRPSDSLESKSALRRLRFPSKRKTSFSEEGRRWRRSTRTSLVAEVTKYFTSTSGSISLRRIEVAEPVLPGLGIPAPRGELARVEDSGDPGVAWRYRAVVVMSLHV